MTLLLNLDVDIYYIVNVNWPIYSRVGKYKNFLEAKALW